MDSNEASHRCIAAMLLAVSSSLLVACGGSDNGSAPAVVVVPESDATEIAVGEDKESQLQWITVAHEGELFALRSGGPVRYGIPAQWITMNLSGDGSCTNEAFGSDPAPGQGKLCQIGVPMAQERAPVTFRNLMMVYRSAQRDGQVWARDDAEIEAIRVAFVQTWPALVAELTGGAVVMENSVVVSDVPITEWSSPGSDTPKPEAMADWPGHVGETGRFDVLFINNPAPQGAMWAVGGGVCCDAGKPQVGMTLVGARDDLGQYQDALAGWTHEWLHVIGESFYRDRLGVQRVPVLHDAERHGYRPDSGAYQHWQAWYADYLNRGVMSEGERWGLGWDAWRRGTLREYLWLGGK